MTRADRVSLISAIERQRGSHVITYILGDRDPVRAQINEDAVRPMYEHLRQIMSLPADQRHDRIDVFLYSRGGNVSVPWRIVSMLREFCGELCVLVPYKAHSAATMIALGADVIVMGPKAELGPIDPTLSRQIQSGGQFPPAEIGVEDVSSYVAFMKERAGLTDQAALASVMAILANSLGPVALGNVNREYSHIRLVAQKLLSSRQSKMDDQRMALIIEALTEKIYSHGHAIGRLEAAEIGLHVDRAEGELEQAMWDLYLAYEEWLRLTDPIDIRLVLAQANADEYVEPEVVIACIESRMRTDKFAGQLRMWQKRQMPIQPQINLNLTLPPGLDPAQVPPNVMQQLMQMVGEAVRQQIMSQAPVVDAGLMGLGLRWTEATNE